MQRVPVVEKIEKLPGPLLREVEDFVDFLLARYGYGPGIQPNYDEYPAAVMSRLAEEGGSFDWLANPAEDIYNDEDGEAI